MKVIVDAAAEATTQRLTTHTKQVTTALEENQKSIHSLQSAIIQQNDAINTMNTRQHFNDAAITELYQRLFPGTTIPARPGLLPTMGTTTGAEPSREPGTAKGHNEGIDLPPPPTSSSSSNAGT